MAPDMAPDNDSVSLWHFPMMNDSARNEGYERALASALKSNEQSGRKTVLEIGTGAGLLSLMAARHGALKVVTFEGVPVIARKAKQIIQRNGYADRIQVIEGLSTSYQVGRDLPGNLPERFDVLVTEIFDDGLLGEGAFKAIKHAKEHLLKPGAQLIPARVRVMAIGIESQEIFNNYRVSEVAGFDVREFNEFTLDDYVGIHLDKMAYRALTRPTPVFSFDFDHLPGPQSIPLDLAVTTPGTLHAIALWFELCLDENTMITTGPGLSKLSSWKQAIHLIDYEEPFRAGETISLQAHHDETAIWFERR
jgi:predicted RNA methylase